MLARFSPPRYIPTLDPGALHLFPPPYPSHHSLHVVRMRYHAPAALAFQQRPDRVGSPTCFHWWPKQRPKRSHNTNVEGPDGNEIPSHKYVDNRSQICHTRRRTAELSPCLVTGNARGSASSSACAFTHGWARTHPGQSSRRAAARAIALAISCYLAHAQLLLRHCGCERKFYPSWFHAISPHLDTSCST